MTAKRNGPVRVVFTGGGTGGHIYPGLAVADELRRRLSESGAAAEIVWIGNSSGMDRRIVESCAGPDGRRVADVFYGIPSGKLRRYVSFRNFLDVFKILGGLAASFVILLRLRPAVLFSKGGFVSVPPCLCARLLGVPVYTHECDFTPGLATRINSRAAKRILVSYQETAGYFRPAYREKITVTGNPVRPAFYSADGERGRRFLNMGGRKEKPVLLVLGGSLGARQINGLVRENLEWLCARFFVVHQTGVQNAAARAEAQADGGGRGEAAAGQAESYRPYPFIYAEMPDVIACADVVLSRAGANSVWECAALGKPLVLLPLCGAGTRGDQEENAEYFRRAGAALVLAGENVTSQALRDALSRMLDSRVRESFAAACAALASGARPAAAIAELLFQELT